MQYPKCYQPYKPARLSENKNFSPVANSFLNHLKSEKKKIIKDKFDWFEQY